MAFYSLNAVSGFNRPLQGDADGAKEWVRDTIKSDEGLLSVLEGMRSWRAVNSEVIYPLTKENVSRFLDYESAYERVKLISESSEPLSSTKKSADMLLEAFSYED